jgi:protein-S-isoprenylcysteine O-methyltransferase Ste14
LLAVGELFMNALSPWTITWALWMVFGVYWAISALSSKKTKRRETWPQRLAYILPLVAASFLLARPEAQRAWLAARVFPFLPAVEWAGVGMVAAGIALCFWARWHLGANWSGTVTLKEGHELIRSGPYRTIRHPIYTGILLALLGTAVQIGQVRGFIAFIIAWLCFYVKARREESFLKDEFGDRLSDHISRTGMFIPRIL